jgi:hypothetical protein
VSADKTLTRGFQPRKQAVRRSVSRDFAFD